MTYLNRRNFTRLALLGAVLLSLALGAYSHRSGIVGNTWRDAASGESVYCSSDSSATYIGHATKPLDGTSPRHLRAESLGDVLKQVDQRSKVLAVSGHDHVNHAFGAESRLSHDHFLQLDRQLQAFSAHLDAKVGAGNYVALLTADHGFMPAPEHNAQLGKPSGRIDPRKALERVNAAVQARFGEGKWVHGFSASGVLLNRGLIKDKQQDAQAMARVVADTLKKEPGIAAAYTRSELLGTPLHEPLYGLMRKSWHPEVSGEVQYTVREGWMFATSHTGTTHGSPYAYDTHVPILVYGPNWVPSGRVDTPVEVADIAPSLATLLRVRAPAQSEGKLLSLR